MISPDDLPMWAMVGATAQEMEEAVQDEMTNSQFASSQQEGQTKQSVFLYAHRALSIAYNGNNIVQVNLTSENPRMVKEGTHTLTD